jgi:hypothetical protein
MIDFWSCIVARWWPAGREGLDSRHDRNYSWVGSFLTSGIYVEEGGGCSGRVFGPGPSCWSGNGAEAGCVVKFFLPGFTF